MFSVKPDIRNRNECIVWSPEMTDETESNKGFVSNKPLMSILDLGKLLLQHSKDGDSSKVQDLIIKGAPFNADWLGMTPLHYAAKRNNYEICEMLLRGGINKDAKTKVDRTALHYAVYEGNKDIVELLLSRNADINIKDMLQMTALHWAIEKRHKAIARLLIKHGADVTALSKFYKTPMTLALQTGQVDLLDELETARHNQRNDVLMDTPDNQSETNEAVNSIAIINASKESDEKSCRSENSNDAMDNQGVSSSKEIKLDSENYLEKTEYIEPIVSPMDDNKQIDESGLEILKTHGITMLPTDSSQNLLTTALQGGRKLVLSEAGKLVLKNTNRVLSPHRIGENVLRKYSNNHINFSNKSHNRQASYFVKNKSETAFKSNKNIKIITMDMFKQMYGNSDMNHRLNKVVRPNSNGTGTLGKLTKLVKLNNVTNKNTATVHKISIEKMDDQSTSDNGEGSESDELPPNIIEICSESGAEDEILDESVYRKQLKVNNEQLSNVSMSTNPSQKCEIPVLDLDEVCRELHSLKSQIEKLRNQLAQSQKQHEIDRSRIEALERNRDPYS